MLIILIVFCVASIRKLLSSTFELGVRTLSDNVHAVGRETHVVKALRDLTSTVTLLVVLFAWPPHVDDVGVGSASCVEMVILYAWAGARLVLETARHAPNSVSTIPWNPGKDMWRAFRLQEPCFAPCKIFQEICVGSSGVVLLSTENWESCESEALNASARLLVYHVRF